MHVSVIFSESNDVLNYICIRIYYSILYLHDKNEHFSLCFSNSISPAVVLEPHVGNFRSFLKLLERFRLPLREV